MTTQGGWFAAKRPVFQFLAIFGLVMVLYFVLRPTPLVTRWLGPWNLRACAVASATVLSWIGEDIDAVGVTIVSDRGGLRIQRGCDIIGPSVLLIASILAFPIRFGMKIPGILLGVPALFVVNLVRIVSLYYTQVHFPEAFLTVHVAIWQPGFVSVVLVMFVAWSSWAAARPAVHVADSG